MERCAALPRPRSRSNLWHHRPPRSADWICQFTRNPWRASSPLRAGLGFRYTQYTWEHIETDPPSTNGGGGAGVNVSLITVTPTSAFPGDQVVANISLTSPAPPGTKVKLSWATQNNPTQTILTVASVPSGATAASINFFAPSVFGGGARRSCTPRNSN